MDNLFAYGTLMCGDIMEEISGCRLSHLHGTLKGYSRHSVKGEYYPAILRDREGSVEGIIYRDLPTWVWGRLDRFEGEMYSRQSVQIKLSSGSFLIAFTYVTRPEFLDQIEESEWDFIDFIRNGKTLFQRNYQGYLSLTT